MAASLWNPGTNTTQTTPASQPFSFVKNTVANPGINFVGDTNTGIWSQADGWLNFVVDGVTKLSISPTGEVTANNFVSGVELDIVSAATTDLGTVDSNSIRITGTNTITSFGVNYRGPKYIRFAASLTLQNSSSLLCPGGANISISAGDTIIVTPKATSGVADGWVVLSYVRSTVAADLSNTVRVDVPSADNTVLLLSSIGSRNVRITGTTPITSFTADNGGLYFVTFAASLTLVNSATLVTNAGGNITTRAGDTCIIRATAYSVVEIMSYDYAVTASFGQGGQIAGNRNKIINGAMAVVQRGNAALSNNSIVYGGPDRWMTGLFNFTTATGIVGQLAGQPVASSTTGFMHIISGLTTTGTGLVQVRQRIEAVNAFGLNGKTITVSGNVAQDTGSTQSLTVRLNKANSEDSFGATTLIANSTTTSVPSGVVTKFTATFNLTATDASNGLELVLEYANVGALTAKNFYLSDVQLEVGSVATAFEQGPFGAELALCQRYYYASGGGVSAFHLPCPSVNSNARFLPMTLPPMRVAPTVTIFGATGSVGAVVLSSPGKTMIRFEIDAGNTAATHSFNSFSASAEL